MARGEPTAPPAEAVTEANLERLFMLSWEGTSKWKQSRHGSQNPRRDVHRQPSQEVLTDALWYLRDLINT